MQNPYHCRYFRSRFHRFGLGRNKPPEKYNSEPLPPNILITQMVKIHRLSKPFCQRNYEPSQITIESTLASNGVYTGYIFSYLSDGLKIYGRMNMPVENSPFPCRYP
jgi:hypothetical protein